MVMMVPEIEALASLFLLVDKKTTAIIKMIENKLRIIILVVFFMDNSKNAIM